MMHHLMRCPVCKSYGLLAACSCGGVRVSPRPPRFSPQDKYGVYRRKIKYGEENQR